MFAELTRRDFLKKTGILGTALALSGCGGRRAEERLIPYLRTPEEQLAGNFTEYASTCQECPAGCGILVRTMGGRAHKIEGNPRHPVNQGALCARGQASLQGLYNPDRTPGPRSRQDDSWSSVSWDEAVERLGQALADAAGAGGGRVAVYGGQLPDHLYRVAALLLANTGGGTPLVWNLDRAASGESHLLAVTEQVFGQRRLPLFNVGAADAVFSFNASFLETWLSPVHYSRGYGQMRRGDGRGFLLQIESRLSLTGASADRWLPVPPGRESEVALVFGRIILDERLASPDRPAGVDAVFQNVQGREIASSLGLDFENLVRLARIFAGARSPLALPGGGLGGHANATGAYGVVFALNLLVGAHTRALGVAASVPDEQFQPVEVVSSFADVRAFVDKMRGGGFDVLLVLDGDPVHDLPGAMDFRAALDQVPLVVDFSSFPTDTAERSHLHLPGHHFLESWGYRIPKPGTSLQTVSSQQPVVQPLLDTRAPADVLLAAARAAGGGVAGELPWETEVDLLRESVALLAAKPAGSVLTADPEAFFARWQQFGGWWSTEEEPRPEGAPSVPALADPRPGLPAEDRTRPFALHVFSHLLLGEGRGANKPWLQEVPDPMTSVMWESWIEIGLQVAEELELETGDLVEVASAASTLEVPVYVHRGLGPDMVALPLGQGHTAYGRYAAERGVNAGNLLVMNDVPDTGELAWAGTRVSLRKTGRSTTLCRLEGSESTAKPTGVW